MMPTDEMLCERFEEILNLINMEDGEIEQAYGLKFGKDKADAFRQGTIATLCRTSIRELKVCIESRNQQLK